MVGQAGEHFVCAALLMDGMPAFLAPAGASWDVGLEVNERILRVQVRSTLRPQQRGRILRPSYTFSLRTSDGRHRRRRTSTFDADLVALVALDILRVGWLTVEESPMTICIASPDEDYTLTRPSRKRFDDLSLSAALNALGAPRDFTTNWQGPQPDGIVCPSCQEQLPKSAFRWVSLVGRPDSACKACRRKASRQRYQVTRRSAKLAEFRLNGADCTMPTHVRRPKHGAVALFETPPHSNGRIDWRAACEEGAVAARLMGWRDITQEAP